jgi:di/tricarboxylate transporter
MESIIFLGLGLDAWITIVTVLTVFITMLFTKISAESAFLGAIAILFVTGVLSSGEALSGFSSPSVVVIGALFVVVSGLVHTGVLQWMTRHLLGTPGSYPKAIMRLMFPVAFLSSFLNNTTVVALFVNVVKMWGRKLNITPSKLLIPLSYASGMGGVCTLIGTPPNMIISGMYAEQTGNAMNVLTPMIPGLFCLAVGVLTMVLLRRLLPERKAPEEGFESTGEYTLEMLVPTSSQHVGQTVEEAQLNNVRGGSLIEIVRFDKEVISPVPADEFIIGGDRLIYAGQIDELIELRKSHGLVNADHHVFSIDEIDPNRKLKTASIGLVSKAIGKRWEETGFEKNDQLTLVAVSRQGERIEASPRDIVLQAGDTLLLECPPKMKNISDETKKQLQFFDSEDLPNIGKKTLVSTLIMIGMIALSSLGVMTLLQAAFIAALAMVICRCCSIDQAMKAINWNILMVFAGSVVMGTAIAKTGLAQMIANGILSVCGDNPIVVMAAICMAGMFTTEFISNTATGAIFFPIIYNAATTMGYDPFPFCVALMIAVSSCFITPIGSPTHMLVYGPGGYRFSDFAKVGFWMALIILATNLLAVNLLWPITPLP